MRILVLGGTGVSGRAVRAEAAGRGHDVRVLARHAPVDPADPADTVEVSPGDVITGEGLDAAMAGVDAVVDCTNIQTLNEDRATRFFTTAVGNAAGAATRAGVGGYVLLSIVGVDRFPYAYYRAKLAQERALAAAAAGTGLTATVARTTQFHDFAGQILARSSVGPLAAVPALRIRPVAIEAVARHLVSLAEAPPAGAAPELSGPRDETLPDLVRRYARATGRRSLVVPLPLPGRAGRANRERVLIPRDGLTDDLTFEAWLARRSARG